MNNRLQGFEKENPENVEHPTTFMASPQARPNTKITPREFIFIAYAFARNWTYKEVKLYSRTEFSFSKPTWVDWNHYLRRVININRAFLPKIGGVGVNVQITYNESLFRGRRKNHVGRMLQGDWGRDARAQNYGNRIDGPWIVGMRDSNRSVRLFFVRNRSAETLIPLIRAVVEPSSEIHTDGSYAYAGLGRAAWDDGQLPFIHKIVNHSEEFVAPSGAHTQAIERVWTDIKINFIKVKRSTSKELFHEHIAYYEWTLNVPYEKRFRSITYLSGRVNNG